MRTFVYKPRASNGGSPADFRRAPSEFVLSPDWDYHAAPTIREYHWVIQDIVANPDGVFRPMIAINGKFPGEMIRCNDGDTIVVNVENQSVNATAIHWHGIFQNGSNWMDGVPGVTQCPIAPGEEISVTGSPFVANLGLVSLYFLTWVCNRQELNIASRLLPWPPGGSRNGWPGWAYRGPFRIREDITECPVRIRQDSHASGLVL